VFEVTFVRANRSGERRAMMGIQPGGTLAFSNVPARMIVEAAYDLRPGQLIGGPGWLNLERFDIMAKAGQEMPREQLNLMLQALLSASRFRRIGRSKRGRGQPLQRDPTDPAIVLP